MKAFILICCLVSLKLPAQWVPLKVEEFILQHAKERKLGIDTIQFENYRYVVNIKYTGLDTMSFTYSLISKKKLYTDYWKAAGVSYFGLAMGSLIVLPHTLPFDKNEHLGAGIAIGGITTWVAWRYTRAGLPNRYRGSYNNQFKYALGWKSKLVCFGIGTGIGAGVALGKEYWYDKHFGGVVSGKDALATTIGAAFGSLGAVIVIGNITKKRPAKYFKQFDY